VLVRDVEGGGEFEVSADSVVNATGVWADQLRPDELYGEEEVPRIRPSRGTHVTISPDLLKLEAGVIVPAGGGRTVFVLPWLGRTLVGTTDNDYEGDIDRIPPSEDDIEYLLDALNSYFGTDLGPDELTGAYAGVRPLISSGDPKKSVDISRRAELYETSSGMLTITGGKLTTFRRMAAQVVDRITQRDGREAESRTDDIPLGMSARPDDLVTSVALPEGATDQLAFRYGHAARAVLDLCEDRAELAQPIAAGHPDLLAEVVIAARREQARSVADVLLRRTRLGLVAAPELRDGESTLAVARLLGEELGWSDSRVAAEQEEWSRVAEAEGLDPSRIPAQ
jgi:glycerol-3-phosphate dehydrogenase